MSNIFEFVDKNNLDFPHVKTSDQARAVAFEWKAFAEQAEFVASAFSPAELEKHATYTSECWEDIAAELERQGK